MIAEIDVIVGLVLVCLLCLEDLDASVTCKLHETRPFFIGVLDET